eukprot:636376-Hanusia_phi.AAC.1
MINIRRGKEEEEEGQKLEEEAERSMINIRRGKEEEEEGEEDQKLEEEGGRNMINIRRGRGGRGAEKERTKKTRTQ